MLRCASLSWPILSVGYGCWSPSKPLLFLPDVFDDFFTNFWSAFPLLAILVLLFDVSNFFIEDVNEDVLAFAIAPDVSVLGFRLRNRSHSAGPLSALVSLSPSLSKMKSSTTVPLSSFSLSLSSSASSSSEFFEVSDSYDEEDLTLCAVDTSCSCSSALLIVSSFW